jgi:hypothetical protein
LQLPVHGHPLHTRALTLGVQLLAEGRWHARGEVIDLRKVGFVPMLSDIQPAGIIHHMSIDLKVDPVTTRIDSIEIDQRAVAIEASASTGGECCRDPAPRLQALAGERLDSAFARQLSGVFGGPRGCSHLLTLFQLMASGLQRAFVLESQLAQGACPREVGDRLFRRAVFVEGFEAEDQSIEMAIQLADFHTQALDAGAPPTQRLAGQWDTRVFARATGPQHLLSDLQLADRTRTGNTLTTATWRDQSPRLQAIEGVPVMPGLAQRLFANFDPEQDRLLLDACLQLAPGFIQVMAAVLDRWLTQTKQPESSSKAAMAEMGQVGGMPDSCYMWRAEGPLASLRAQRQPQEPAR